MMKKPKRRHEDEPEEMVEDVEPQDIPPNLQVSPSVIGPITGVVDGSDAAPGEVGEFLTATGTFAYGAGVAGGVGFTGQINLLTLPPGDWDLTVSSSYSGLITASLFFLNPQPTGVSNEMFGLNGNLTFPGEAEEVVIVGQCARGSFAVNTNLSFEVQVYQSSAALLAGTMTMRIEARRRR